MNYHIVTVLVLRLRIFRWLGERSQWYERYTKTGSFLGYWWKLSGIPVFIVCPLPLPPEWRLPVKREQAVISGDCSYLPDLCKQCRAKSTYRCIRLLGTWKPSPIGIHLSLSSLLETNHRRISGHTHWIPEGFRKKLIVSKSMYLFFCGTNRLYLCHIFYFVKRFLRLFRFLLENQHISDIFGYYNKCQIVDKTSAISPS